MIFFYNEQDQICKVIEIEGNTAQSHVNLHFGEMWKTSRKLSRRSLRKFLLKLLKVGKNKEIYSLLSKQLMVVFLDLGLENVTAVVTANVEVVAFAVGGAAVL